jgi:hypothetical protein
MAEPTTDNRKTQDRYLYQLPIFRVQTVKKQELEMKRFVIRNKTTGEFLKGTGKNGEWVKDFANADLFQKKLTDFWWRENEMELVPVTVSLV